MLNEGVSKNCILLGKGIFFRSLKQFLKGWEMSFQGNIKGLPQEEFLFSMKDEFLKKSTFQRIFNKDFLNLDIYKYSLCFRDSIISKFKNMEITIDKLEDLHQFIDSDLKEYNFDDGVNKISQQFYEMDENFYQIYYNFLKYIQSNFFKFDFYFQKTPTIRLHTPKSPNNNHYPRYHSDIVYGHPPQEINIWVPLTPLDPLDHHGFKIMDVENTYNIFNGYDFNFEKFIDSAIHDPQLTQRCHHMAQDVKTNFGEMLAFDSRCIHTGMPLMQKSRVSIDIRIIPRNEMDTLGITYQGKGRRKILFIPGESYHINSICEIIK